MSAPTLDPGPRPELAWLPLDRLDIDPAYQRSLATPAGTRQGLRLGYRPELDGKAVTIELLYAVANELRAKAGLAAVEPPPAPGEGRAA